MKKLIIAVLAVLSLEAPAYALSDNYFLLERDGIVCVFEDSETDQQLSLSTGIPVKSLPQSDQQLLKTGIAVHGREELLHILEDYGS